jgi:hypothetical protein
MTVYKDEINYVGHDFNTTTLTLDGEHVVQGLESLEVERTKDATSVQEVADGTGIFVNHPSKSGQVRFTILEASPSTSVLQTLYDSGAVFKVSVLDSNAPELDCSGRCKIMKMPVVKRGAEADLVQWTLVAVYLKTKVGSYTLASA